MTESRSAAQIWDTALGELQLQVSRPNYRTWLEKTSGIKFQDNQMIIGVPNTFVAEYLERNQLSLIEKVLTNIVRRDVSICFQVNDFKHSQARKNGNGARQDSLQSPLPLFNPKYTFDSFVVGNSNQLAYAAAMGVAREPGNGYNPLYIYGKSGLGKTHLLQAIGRAAAASEMKVMYVRAEEYTNHLMTALREKKMDEFRAKYRNVDMLLVDDVQFFTGKAQTAENFYHTFDELHNANHQIAVTSDCPPREMQILKGRLRSRFEGGLVTDIQEPDFDTRLAILQARAEAQGLDINEDVLEFIALQVKQNIRALEGCLNRVIAYARLVRTALTPELAARALKDIAGSILQAAPVTPNLIVEAVVTHFQLTPSDLKGRKRDEATALARQVAMYLIRQETECSLEEIGRELGGRTPATISHGYQKIAEDMKNNPSLSRKVLDIRQELRKPARVAD